MKGFLTASFALIVLGTILSSDYGIARIEEGTSVTARLIKRAMSPEVAAIPNRAGATAAASSPVYEGKVTAGSYAGRPSGGQTTLGGL